MGHNRKGDSSVTDILIIVGILVFCLVIALFGSFVIFGIATSATLSSSENAAREISSKLVKLDSNTLDKVEITYDMPLSQTSSDDEFNITIKENHLFVQQTVQNSKGEDRIRIGQEVLPNLNIQESECENVVSLRFTKENDFIKVEYCDKKSSECTSWAVCI